MGAPGYNGAHGEERKRTCTPDLLLVDLLELLREVLAVRRAAVELERPTSFGAIADRFVELE